MSELAGPVLDILGAVVQIINLLDERDRNHDDKVLPALLIGSIAPPRFTPFTEVAVTAIGNVFQVR